MFRIKELREAKEINMREAARLLDMPYTTYVNYEKGLREPTSEVLIQLADFYNVSIDYLIGRNSNVNHNGVSDSLVSADILDEAVKPLKQPKNCNIIRIAARNGSYQERILSDEQLAALEAVLSQMPDVADDI